MSRDDDRYQQKDAEKPEARKQDRLGEDDKEGMPVAEADGPSLMDTVSDPDVDTDPAEAIEEKASRSTAITPDATATRILPAVTWLQRAPQSS